MTLQEQLAAIEQALPRDKAGEVAAHVARLVAAGVGRKALKVGDSAPNFILPDGHGNALALRALLLDGPVVVVFYRGRWCPYCSAELAAFQLALPEIRKRGARLVAISPELPDSSLTAEEVDKLSFEVLSDTGNRTARQFGLVYRLDDEAHEMLASLGVDLAAFNGDESRELPVPATFIVDRDRRIVFASVDPDYRKRADPADVVAALDALAARH